MRERPILMSGPLVRAVLEGRKTQTRRVYRPRVPDPYEIMDALADDRTWPHAMDEYGDYHPVPCPYGQVGDRLWVRESYAPNYFGPGRHGYMADWTSPDGVPKPRWTPSIHMKREHSRLTLRITDVRVERLQDISEEDARAEGCEPLSVVRGTADGMALGVSYRQSFRFLWDSIAAKGTTWADNPWTWAISFQQAVTP